MRLFALALLLLVASTSSIAVAQEGAAVRHVAAGPDDTAFATTDEDLYGTDDGGVSWTRVPDPDLGPLLGLAVTPGAAPVVWGPLSFTNTSCWNYPHRSDDGGQTWTDLAFDPVDLFVSSVAGGYVLAAHFGSPPQTPPCVSRLARSTDDGATWMTVVESEPFAGGGPLTVSARAARAAFVTTGGDFTEGPPDSLWAVVHRSGDGGETWTQVPTTGAFGSAAPGGEPPWPDRSALAPDGALYAWDTEAAALYCLPPSGETWEPVALPTGTAAARALDVGAGGTLHLGTDGGAFVSGDGGETWVPDGLEGRPVEALTRTGAGTLLALADGAVWRRLGAAAWARSEVVVEAESAAPARGALGVVSHPNPFTDGLHVDLTGAAPGPAAVLVFDVLGRRVTTSSVVVPSGGVVSWALDRADLPSGPYLVVVTDATGRRTSQRVTKL